VYKAGEGWVKGNGKPVPVAEDIIITDGSHLVNGKLKPNTKYQAGENGYTYKTNKNGVIVEGEADLKMKTHEGRLKHNPDTPGKLPGDHAGHIFGDQFGGSPELDNLVSQLSDVNLSKYKILENQWAKALKQGKKVTVKVTINYAPDGVRPVSFKINYTIDGVQYSVFMEN
jgi:hypothetical protein